jgi:hypothetical protein
MAPGQDWCLECGTAAPGRIGGKPGWRAGATVVGITLLLVAGAVAASYAALSGDANREAAKPAPPSATPVAQAPPAAVPGQPGAVAPGATIPGATTPGATTPGVTTPSAIKPPRIFPQGNQAPSAVNQTPIPTTQTPTVTPSPGATTPTPTTPSTPKPTKPAGPQTIALGADALSLYDPYKNATAQGDPADADDNNGDTAWFVTSKNAASMGVGMLVDLESARGVKVLGLVTKTPGFRVEVYGADSELPADVLDTRWTHIRDRSRVDETSKDGTKAGDAMERIVLGGGTSKYRYMLLWFTTPPDAGPTVRLTQVVLQA